MRTIHQLDANDRKWIEEFVAGLGKTDLSPVTVKGYRHDMELFLRWFKEACGDETQLETISSIDIINYRQHMIGIERLKAATVNRRLQALRRFCRWACRQGKLSSDPTAEVKTLKTAPRRQPAGLEVKEAAGRARKGAFLVFVAIFVATCRGREYHGCSVGEAGRMEHALQQASEQITAGGTRT